MSATTMEARLTQRHKETAERYNIPERYAHDPDLVLMLKVKEGDDAAFNQLIVKHEKAVMSLVYRFTGNAEVAEDLAQEVFLRVYRAASRFEPRAKFFTYLYKVTLNLCRNHRDKAKRRQTSSLDQSKPGYEDSGITLADELVSPDAGADEQAERSELAQVVRRAVLDLPKEQREAVILQRFEGLSYEEIAHTLDLSIPAVKSRIHRAKLNLQEKIAPYLEKGHEPNLNSTKEAK